jgi:hypothetical protein
LFSKEGPALFYFGIASVFFGLLVSTVIAAGATLLTWWSNDAYKPTIHPFENLTEVLSSEESPEQAASQPVVSLVRKGLVEAGSGGRSVPVLQGGQMSRRAGNPTNKPASAPPVPTATPAAKQAASAPTAPSAPAPAALPAPKEEAAPAPAALPAAKGAMSAPEGSAQTATGTPPVTVREPVTTPTYPANIPPTPPAASPGPPAPQAAPAIVLAEPPPKGADEPHNRGRGGDDKRRTALTK